MQRFLRGCFSLRSYHMFCLVFMCAGSERTKYFIGSAFRLHGNSVFGGWKTQKSEDPFQSEEFWKRSAARFRVHGPKRKTMLDLLTLYTRLRHTHVPGQENKQTCRSNKQTGIVSTVVQNLYAYNHWTETGIQLPPWNFGCTNPSQASQADLDQTWQNQSVAHFQSNSTHSCVPVCTQISSWKRSSKRG